MSTVLKVVAMVSCIAVVAIVIVLVTAKAGYSPNRRRK